MVNPMEHKNKASIFFAPCCNLGAQNRADRALKNSLSKAGQDEAFSFSLPLGASSFKLKIFLSGKLLSLGSVELGGMCGLAERVFYKLLNLKASI